MAGRLRRPPTLLGNLSGPQDPPCALRRELSEYDRTRRETVKVLHICSTTHILFLTSSDYAWNERSSQPKLVETLHRRTSRRHGPRERDPGNGRRREGQPRRSKGKDEGVPVLPRPVSHRWSYCHTCKWTSPLPNGNIKSIRDTKPLYLSTTTQSQLVTSRKGTRCVPHSQPNHR